MITQVRITLKYDGKTKPQKEWAYRLYGALLENVSNEYGNQLHLDKTTPIAHYLNVKEKELKWIVNILGSDNEKILFPILQNTKKIVLNGSNEQLAVANMCVQTIKTVDELFAIAMNQTGRHSLEFVTPVAFKSQGQYINLPSTKLILQNLVKKWNGCFPEIQIEDEDGEGVDALARGIRCKKFHIYDRGYHLKGNYIPGSIGNMIFENSLDGFQKQLADTLLFFSEYAGIGIKTALGMGGVEHSYLK